NDIPPSAVAMAAFEKRTMRQEIPSRHPVRTASTGFRRFRQLIRSFRQLARKMFKKISLCGQSENKTRPPAKENSVCSAFPRCVALHCAKRLPNDDTAVGQLRRER